MEIKELLQEWAENHQDMNIEAVIDELHSLFQALDGETARKEWCAHA